MKRPILFIVLALLARLAGSVSAVTFTITPTAISNTYAGTITLQISGLTNTETVVVQKFLDANANGVVDAGDILWQQFQLTDGSASLFHDGGTAVTNFNVPGDTDGAANGAIAAKLYPSFDFAQLIVGKYLVVLSSPVGHFSPLTNSFAVTNFPFAQTFTGNVVSNGVPVPNAIIILFQPSGGGQNPQGGAVANNSGVYTIKVPTGTYQLGAFKSNFVANLAVSPYVTLGTGATIITNVPVTGATQSIFGNVIDVNNSSHGLAGFLVPVQSPDNLFALAFTDTNGNFTARVTPDRWKISSNGKTLAFKGYLASQNSTTVDTTAGSVSGVTIAVPKATAVFYGTVKDNLGNPLPGVAIYSSDNNGNYETDGYTDTAGNYVAGALGGLNNDQWQASYDSGSFTNYIFLGGSGNVTLASGQAYHQNFTALLATNHLSGNVQFNGNPVSGVGVNAGATINGVGYRPNTAHTDGNGHYSFNVANGDWNVGLNVNGGSDSLDRILGSGNYQPPNDQNVNINNNNSTANFTILPSGGGSDQIVNGGYETGDFTEWILLGDTTSTYVDDGSGSGIMPRSGSYEAALGTSDSQGYLAQTLTTIPGARYLLSFWFNNSYADPGEFSVSWSGETLLDEVNPEAGDWTNIQFTVTATKTNTVLQFGFQDDYEYFGLDDVSLQPSGQVNPIIQFTAYPANGAPPLAVQFSSPSVDSFGSNVVSWSWHFGDGASSTLQKPTHNYSAAGTFSPTLVGTNDHGSAVLGFGPTITVANPTIQFTANPASGAPPLAVQFNSPSVDSFGSNVVSWNWHFGDGGSSTLQNPTHNYSAVGNFAPTLVATNNHGSAVLGIGPAIIVTEFKNLYNFGNGSAFNPSASLVLSDINLYGTASGGGSFGGGTVFKLNTNGLSFTNLHSFTASSYPNYTNSDGALPLAGLILLGDTLYGTTYRGGTNGNGMVFAVNTDGTVFRHLHRFTTATATNSSSYIINWTVVHSCSGVQLI